MRRVFFILLALAISGGGFLFLQNKNLTDINELLSLSSDPLEVLSYRLGEKSGGKTRLSSYLDENAASCIPTAAEKTGPEFKQKLASVQIVFGQPFQIGSYQINCKISGNPDEVILTPLAPATITLHRNTSPSLSVEVQAGSVRIISQKLALGLQMSSVLELKSNSAVALVAGVTPGSPSTFNLESGSLSIRTISNGANPVIFKLGQYAVLKSEGKELATSGATLTLFPSGFVK